MLKFFRRIRQKLLAEGKLKSYLFYAIGEIILVVVGILIALQINNWNEGRKERVAALNMLSNLREEFVENTNSLERVIEEHTSSVESIRELVSLFGPEAEPIDADEFTRLMVSIYYAPSYKPSDEVLRSALSSNRFAQLQDGALRRHLNRWPGLVQGYESSYGFLVLNSDVVDAIVLQHFSPRNFGVDLGRGSVGKSLFETDQRALLRNRVFEGLVEMARLNAELLLNQSNDLLEFQKKLGEMIDTELARAGR